METTTVKFKEWLRLTGRWSHEESKEHTIYVSADSVWYFEETTKDGLAMRVCFKASADGGNVEGWFRATKISQVELRTQHPVFQG